MDKEQAKCALSVVSTAGALFRKCDVMGQRMVGTASLEGLVLVPIAELDELRRAHSRFVRSLSAAKAQEPKP